MPFTRSPPPPLEVASHSLRCSYFLGPIGLGHFRMRCTNPQRCALVAGHDIFGVGGRWMPLPPSASNKLVPPPLEVLPSAFPPRSSRCPSWAIVLRGPESPLSLCARRWGCTMCQTVACWGAMLKDSASVGGEVCSLVLDSGRPGEDGVDGLVVFGCWLGVGRVVIVQ